MDNNETNNLVSLYKKIHTAKSKIGAVVKSSNNPFFKTKYADLNAHLEVIEPICQELGLVLTQSTLANPQLGNVVKTDITDIDTGAQISSVLQLPKLEDMQKLGGAITYARRYTLGALLAIQTDDDDGETATGRGNFVKAKATTAKAISKDF
jgi:ERF superfamily